MLAKVSIVIPTFREEEISRTLDRLAEHLKSVHDARFEILVVDDTGEDARANMRASWASSPKGNVTLDVLSGPKRGKGAAVRAGVLASSGDVVFTMDADLPVALDQVERFLARIESGVDAVVAERPMTRNLENPLRFVLSRGLYAFQRYVVFGAHVFDDTQCGFKAFRGALARELASKQAIDGGMYDIEYLYLAHRANARIERVEVVPNPEWRASKIDAWKALRRDPKDLLLVKWRALRGDYD
jgi:dolichyl-phosphate beta-glucosyltransferase